MREEPDVETIMLKRLTEGRLAGFNQERLVPPDHAELARLLHELQAHQVELEMQNEELRLSRAELDAGSRRLNELYDFAPAGYFSITAAGQIRQLNLVGAGLLGNDRDQLQGKAFRDYVAAGDHATFDHFLRDVFSGHPADPCEIKLDPPQGHEAVIQISGVLAPDRSVCRIAAMNVTAQRRAERAERERIEDLDRIFELSPDLIGIAGRDGCFHRVNPAFERILGYSREELTGRCYLHFVHPDDREATVGQMVRLEAGEEIKDFVNRYRCKDGTYRSLEWRATSYRQDVIYAMARDITGRQETEDALRLSEAKFRSIIESTPTAIYLYQLTQDGRLVLTDFNPAADRETGISHASLIGKTVEEAFPALIGTGVPQKFKEVAAGGITPQPFVVRYDDERISGVFDVSVFQTGPGMIAVAFQDISERIRAEEELKNARDELESRVRQRTSQLQERTLQLSKLARELTQVEERERRRIAALIHDDLQQMLVAALLNLGMLKSSVSGGEVAADFAHIEGILRDSIQTTRSLTAELSPSVLHQSGLAPALHWLRAWCMETYGLEVAVKAAGEIDPGPEACVTLFRCVRELLFNIVKHAGVKSAELAMARGPDGRVRIEVSDKGRGFDPEALRFREDVAGGFGLFSVRERLDLLGGGLEVESSPGRGSRFVLWVPLPVAGHPALSEDALEGCGHPQPDPTPGDGRSMSAGELVPRTRIVVADDHGPVRVGLVRLLESEAGFEVVGQAADGVEALELARLLRPDAVVTDLNMPRMNGLELTAVIHRELPAVHVLGLSIEVDDDRRAAMLRAGAVDLLHKNQSAAELIAALRLHSATAGPAANA